MYNPYMNIINKNESYAVVGACMQVHRTLGCGFLETVYQEALELEFQKQNIPYSREEKLEIYYKEHTLHQYYVADFICYNSIILELKALESLSNIHTAQVINYLKASDLRLGILVNFGRISLESKRIVL